MIVIIRLDVPDEDRRTIRKARGEKGLATRKEIKMYVGSAWWGFMDDQALDADLRENGDNEDV